MDVSINVFMYLLVLPLLAIAALLAIRHNKKYDEDNFEDK